MESAKRCESGAESPSLEPSQLTESVLLSPILCSFVFRFGNKKNPNFGIRKPTLTTTKTKPRRYVFQKMSVSQFPRAIRRRWFPTDAFHAPCN